jgi:hypothetical protein
MRKALVSQLVTINAVLCLGANVLKVILQQFDPVGKPKIEVLRTNIWDFQFRKEEWLMENSKV